MQPCVKTVCQNERARAWIFTINNPVQDKDDLVQSLERLTPVAYAFQKERGKEGTEHW